MELLVAFLIPISFLILTLRVSARMTDFRIPALRIVWYLFRAASRMRRGERAARRSARLLPRERRYEDGT